MGGLFPTFEVDFKPFEKGECLQRKLEHIERRHVVVWGWFEIREDGDGHDGTPLLLLLHHQLHREDILNLSCGFDSQSKLLLVEDLPGRRPGSCSTFPQLFRHFTFPRAI